MEIITGYTGSPHVTAAQHASLWRGFLTSEGSGVLIDPVTETFETQIQTNNQIRIRSGIGVLQGRAFWVQPGSYDEITINNGNQGENRIDLVVARYTKNPETSVESINWMVIQGTPTTGTPKVPSYTKGNIDSGDNTVDMPMFQVLIEDITLESVTPVYTMAAADYELDPKNEIQSGDDLNNYTDFGNWLCPNAAVAKTLKNCPLTDQGFSLRVMRGTSGAYRVQEIIAGLGDRIYRHYTGTTWSQWKIGAGAKLLWENASPTSSFSPQTLDSDDGIDLSEYNSVKIVSIFSNNYSEYLAQDLEIPIGKNGVINIGLSSGTNFSGAVCNAARTVSVGTKSIAFGRGANYVSNGSNEPANSFAVPIKIYGIRRV